MPCPCTSLTVWLESIKVERATNRGSGIFETVFGRLSTRDEVSFAAISQGVTLEYPSNGRLAWPTEGTTYSLSAQDPPVPSERVKVATVVPFGSSCDVQLATFIEFYEHDWESLESLIDQAVEQAAAIGLIQAPTPIGGFLTPLVNSAIKVAKEILNILTSLKSEKMGEVPFDLPAHRLDDTVNLDQFPWRGLNRDRISDKQLDSFRYTTYPENYGGRWKVVFYVERICDRRTAIEEPSAPGSSTESPVPTPTSQTEPHS
jgi:hypothetical protein